jgi:hypothetical protein
VDNVMTEQDRPGGVDLYASVLGAGDGLNEPPAPIGQWTVPTEIALVDGRLHWDGEGPRRTGAQGPKMLTNFVLLADAPDERIRDYAQTCGVLGLCSHGWPHTHNWPALRGAEFGPSPCHSDPDGESVDRWRALARQALSLLNVSNGLLNGRPSSDEDWAWDPSYVVARSKPHPSWTALRDDIAREMFGAHEPAKRRTMATDQPDENALLLGADRLRVAYWVQTWIAIANIRPEFRWDPITDLPTIDVIPGSLFGALAFDLAYTISRAEPMKLCHDCKRFFAPETQDRPGPKYRYCDDCRTQRKRWARAKQRQRERNQR